MNTTRMALIVALGGVLFAGAALGNERQLTFTHTSDVLAPGAVELEPWTTVRHGREAFFYRLDQRLEMEAGVVDGLQVAAYLNTSAKLFDEGEGELRTRTNEFTWDGLSLEAKYKVMDAAADAVGLALYFEPTLASDELELEFKLIVDKRLGNLLLAGNLVAEYEFAFGDVELAREFKVELDLAAAWQVTEALSLGLEVRSHNVSPVGEGWKYSALYAGPVVAVHAKAVWAALSVMPQVAALQGPSPDLTEHERVTARLLLGFRL